jgi:sarcosine oxidase subunit alpha
LRGACDGCLARVDGVPNVMTCRAPAVEGMQIETQNVVGSGRTDLLRVADWFFPEGMNHHELLAGVPGAQRILQAIARRIAGLGKLPSAASAAEEQVDPNSHARPPRPSASRREADVLVVGAGPAGMAVALELTKRRRHVEVIDDGLAWGGGARAMRSSFGSELSLRSSMRHPSSFGSELSLRSSMRHPSSFGSELSLRSSLWQPLWLAFEKAVAQSRIALRLRTTAAGVYGDDVLVAGEEGVEVVAARTLVLAPGAHDGVMAFEGNDVPGVMSARAAGWLLSHGVTVGKRVLVAVADGGGPFGEDYVRAVPSATLVRGAPVRVRGSARVNEVTIAGPRGERRYACDALLVDAPRSPAYEVCAQAGAELTHEPRGFVVSARDGRIRDGVFAVGEAVGTPFEPQAIANEAAMVAERM